MGDTPYAITGDYPEETETTHVAVSIMGDTPILGEMSSLISMNRYTGDQVRMYIYSVSVGITAYGPVDEETASIIGSIRTAIQENRAKFLSKSVGITRFANLSGVSSPSMTEGGSRKTWATRITMVIDVSETITANIY